MPADSELPQRFVRDPAEDALAELFRRHLGLVYSVALRSVAGDTHPRIELRRDRLINWPLANARRESGFNAVNLLRGYPPVRIVAPTFLIHGHEEKTL